MERLTERTSKGIVVKEDYGERTLKTLYQCSGEKPLAHYQNCDEGYCAMERLADYEDAEERLADMFGGSLTLEMVVNELKQQLKELDSPHPANARILTHKESADWDAYREIGTPEECRAAVEKQNEKQIIDNTPTEGDVWYQCPACKGDLTKIRSFCCPYCGQRLSWNSKQYCSTCTWYDVDSGVCCDGESKHQANFQCLDDTGEKREENNAAG